MSSRLSLAFLFTLIFCGLSIVFVLPALAVNCDVGTCINICSKGKHGTSLQTCNSSCQITIADRKKSKQCK
jgi:hypothetical protein